jgi:hypothetical protein
MLLPVHIVAGALAVIFGFTALFVRKGGTFHRRSGVLFVVAMIVMGLTASVLEYLKSASPANLGAAILSLYFVGTAWTTVRKPSRWTRAINVTAMSVAVGLALLLAFGATKMIRTPGLSSGGVPFRTIGVMSIVLATMLLVAAAGDLRIMRSGLPQGGRRLARHLWRMCFALFIAAGSFFSIRERVARILPEPFTGGWMRALPILVLFAMMFYWLWRVRRPRSPVLSPES